MISDFKLKWIVCALLVAALEAAAYSAEPVNVMKLTLNGALENGASVYLCKVASHKPVRDEGPGAEDGYVTLTVQKVLFGMEQKEITLPYRRPHAMRDDINSKLYAAEWKGRLRWPDFKEGDLLLCVVVPNAKDPLTPTDIGSVASDVQTINNESAAALRETTAMCELYKLKGTDKFAPALEKALDDDDGVVRDFAVEVVLLSLGGTSPDDALQIVRFLAADSKESPLAVGDAVVVISLIRNRRDYAEHSKNMFFTRSLAALAQSPVPGVASDAVKLLDSHGTAHDPHLQDGLTAAEKRTLREEKVIK